MTTTPLAKAVTTLEGQLVIVLDALCAVLSAVDPHTLPPTWAGAFATVLTVALTLQRGVLKAASLHQAAAAKSLELWPESVTVHNAEPGASVPGPGGGATHPPPPPGSDWQEAPSQ